jgi:WD40 repeat protein
MPWLGFWDTTACLWDLSAENIQASVIRLLGHQKPIRAVAISRTNRWAATGSDDATVRLWNLKDSHPADSALVLRGHTKAVEQVSFTRAGEWLATL